MNQIKIEVADTCFSLNLQHPIAEERLLSHYKDFLSHKFPQICINVKFVSKITKSEKDFGSLIYQTKIWRLYRNGQEWFLFFLGGSLAQFSIPPKDVEFLAEGPKEWQHLFYILPEFILTAFLSQGRGVVFHSSGVAEDDKGYLFLAPGGGGKSTIAKLRGERTLLNDDRIIVRKDRKGFRMYGNPWHGEVRITSRQSTNLNKVFFLKKERKNVIILLSKVDALKRLLKNGFMPFWGDDSTKYTLQFCAEIVESVPCFELGFLPDESIWTFIEDYEMATKKIN
ncbi:MAG: hypothetical protein HQ593_05290 [Candidatus Omnitrophica bacterium]|nr:hypothetical protein [Candidatus Omnitrophota bacterium]